MDAYVLVSNRGIFIRGRKRAQGNEKVHSDGGSRVTFSSRVLFYRHRHYCRCLPTLFRVLTLPPRSFAFTFLSQEARTCHGKTLLSTRIKQVIAHETKLFPRSRLRSHAPWAFRKIALRIDALPGYARGCITRKFLD